MNVCVYGISYVPVLIIWKKEPCVCVAFWVLFRTLHTFLYFYHTTKQTNLELSSFESIHFLHFTVCVCVVSATVNTQERRKQVYNWQLERTVWAEFDQQQRVYLKNCSRTRISEISLISSKIGDSSIYVIHLNVINNWPASGRLC